MYRNRFKAKEWREWKHITKLDPDKLNKEDMVQQVITSGTDAIMISGTQRITKEKVEKLLSYLKDSDLPIILEPANKNAVTLDVDYIFIPMVLNAGIKWWLVDAHYDWLKESIEMEVDLDWERILLEAYIVLNEGSAVAKVTESKTNLTASEVLAYATYADRLIHSPIIYIEYSGKFGDPELVKKVKNNLHNTVLFYGGGIDTRNKAQKMSEFATIIVGNIVYKNFDKYLDTIVHK